MVTEILKRIEELVSQTDEGNYTVMGFDEQDLSVYSVAVNIGLEEAKKFQAEDSEFDIIDSDGNGLVTVEKTYDDIIKGRLPKATRRQRTEERKLGSILKEELDKIKELFKEYTKLPPRKELQDALGKTLVTLPFMLKEKANTAIEKIYKRIIEDVEKEVRVDVNINLGYEAIDEQAVRRLQGQRLLNNAYSGLSDEMSKRINALIDAEYEKVGLNWAALTKKLEDELKIGEHRLDRIVRTETQNISNHARENSYKKVDPTDSFKYKWVGPTDKRTTSICSKVRELTKNGVSRSELKRVIKKVADQNIYMETRPFTPHINCRHTHIKAI